MPVPTETFRSIRKLNILFAIASVFFLFVTAWLIFDDWNRPWREYQQDARQWQAVLTADWIKRVDTDQLKLELGQKEEEIRRVRSALPTDTIVRLERELADLQTERIKKDLPAARAKSEIVPTEQLIERARLQFGEEGAQTVALRAKLRDILSDYEEKRAALAAATELVTKKEEEIAAYRKAEDDQKKDLENLARERRTLEDKLAKLKPTGLGVLGEKGRNAPLVDWFNPSEKIEQVIVPGVRTDLNFFTVETADACQTCHTNIDKPEFAEGDLVRFLSRQLAAADNQDVNTLDNAAVAIGFWENAIEKLAHTGGDASVGPGYRQVQFDTLMRINTKRIDSGEKTLPELAIVKALGEKPAATWTAAQATQWHEVLSSELTRIAQTAGNESVSRRAWYEQRLLYMDDLQSLIKKTVGPKEFGLLQSYFRHTLIEQFNAVRKERGSAAVSTSPVMLAHPRLDLYLDPDSPHPLKTMGCSVCHEGSGQDTSFFHTAHTPRDIWVDVDSGATIASFLLTTDEKDQGDIATLRSRIRQQQSAPVAPAPKKDVLVNAGAPAGSITLASATPVAAEGEAKKHDDSEADRAHGVLSSGQDVNLLTPSHPAPFAPPAPDHHEARLYMDPATQQARVAVKQKTYWERKYHWHAVHLVDWEKPMHAMEYVQSSCTKCHTNHYDLRESAPKVFEGRKLFAQVGCANCHAVEQIAEHKDLKKVGPNLSNLKEKLSPSMIATWIWSPKAFRPTSRMPHFFMLENNSSPVDLLRTRIEVAAITQYLLSAPPSSLERIAILMQEDGKLLAEREIKATLGSRKFEIDKRRTAIAADVAALKQAGIARYQPELVPTLAKVNTLSDEAESIKAKLKDAATKAEEKPALEARLAAIDGEIKTAKEKPMLGDAKRGRELFMGTPGSTVAYGGVGCVACHTNLNETGQQWITGDLMSREGLSSENALKHYQSLTYNQQHTYVLQYLGEHFNRRGPELSGVGTKLQAGRTPQQAQGWLYDWLRNPSHYSSYTIMPSFRLSEQEALDLTAYLLQQQRPGDAAGSTYTAVDFIAEVKGELNAEMLNALTKKLGGNEALPVEAKLNFVGKKLVLHYNCQACHQINGYEATASSAPQLNDWGLKDPHKLDYGYFEHAEERRRREPAHVWKVAHEGLGADAAKITAFVGGDAHVINPHLQNRAVAWEHIDGDRREWATQKLHNTRIFDRGKYVVTEAVAELDPKGIKDEALSMRQAMDKGIDRAYDKLKMPKFFLTNEEAQAIITFVTSVRKPLVDPELQKVADDAGIRATVGRQIAEKYNCYGCHNIDANEVAIHAYYDVHNEHGQFNGNFERLMNAPPRLIGQGAKTQPDWVVHFLDNVHPLRPWLQVRMPSFHFDGDDRTGIAEYFAGATQTDAKRIARILAPIDAQLEKNATRKRDLDIEMAKITERLAENEKATDPKQKISDNSILAMTNRQRQIESQKASTDRWSEQPALAVPVHRLKTFALRNDLSQPRVFDPRQTTADDRLATFDGALGAARFLHDAYQVQYPYPPLRLPDISVERFVRGEALFNQVLCAKCHALGDEEKLLALWKLENPNAGTPQPPAAPGDDYDDAPAKPKPPAAAPVPTSAPAAPAAAPATATAPTPATAPAAAAADDDYGDDPAAAAPVAPVGPAWSAPNLKYAVHRIQPQWAEKWLQRSLIILPGTKMPNQWAGPSPLDSFFFQFPDEAKIEAHKKFYYTGPEQRQLILDYIYAAGMRNYTPSLWKLEGKEPPQVALSEVYPPKPDEFKLPEVVDTSKTAAGPTITGPVTAAEVKLKSDIVLHDGDAPYEGEALHGNKTRVVGLIKLDGARPRRNIIRMASDPYCEKAHKDDVFDESLVVNTDGTLQNAFVQIKSVPGKFDVPTTPVVLDQKGCIYYPHVAGVMAGQPLIALNSDGTLHNVHLMPKKNPEKNVGQPAKGMRETIIMKNPEENILIKCDVHAWMNARVHVVAHPFFFVSDVEGRFEIRGLPPGKYTLEVLHELSRIEKQSIEIEVKADTSTRLDVTMKQ